MSRKSRRNKREGFEGDSMFASLERFFRQHMLLGHSIVVAEDPRGFGCMYICESCDGSIAARVLEAGLRSGDRGGTVH
jgi:hypothetical protein